MERHSRPQDLEHLDGGHLRSRRGGGRREEAVGARRESEGRRESVHGEDRKPECAEDSGFYERCRQRQQRRWPGRQCPRQRRRTRVQRPCLRMSRQGMTLLCLAVKGAAMEASPGFTMLLACRRCRGGQAGAGR